MNNQGFLCLIADSKDFKAALLGYLIFVIILLAIKFESKRLNRLLGIRIGRIAAALLFALVLMLWAIVGDYIFNPLTQKYP
ncbi:MAG: hypothetical protein M5Z89_10405 [Olivibacter sp.]|nr:hypothetical protein [Olivibacter sp. UJ_SKK_5.1]